MRPKLRAITLGLGLACSIGLSVTRVEAQTRLPRVYLQGPAGHEDVLNRLSAELQSDGFEPVLLAADAPAPCGLKSAAEDREGAALAGIVIHLDESADQLVAELCEVPAPTAPDQAVVRGPSDEPGRFALATVEALNGLTAAPHLGQARRASRVPVLIEGRSPGPFSSGFASAVLVLQPGGVGPLAGASIGLDAPIRRQVAMEVEVFVPFRASDASGLNRRLSIEAAWARLGARVSSVWSELDFGASLHAGLSFVWATARSRDPLVVGTSDLTTAALVSGGVWLEYPRQSPVYFRAAAHADRLLPSARVELGGGSSRAFGELLLEFGLGAGVRWSSK